MFRSWEDIVAARIIDGKALAQQVREGLAKESAAVLAKTGMKPGLATILVGDDPASHLYVKSKQKACDAAGIYIDDSKLPANTTQADLLALISQKNADPKIHGILVQLPLPKHIDSKVVLDAVSAQKDADGFHPYNFGRLVEGSPVFEACTPKGVIKMIESTGRVDRGQAGRGAGPQQHCRQTARADVAPSQCHGDDLPFEDERFAGGLPRSRAVAGGDRESQVRHG